MREAKLEYRLVPKRLHMGGGVVPLCQTDMSSSRTRCRSMYLFAPSSSTRSSRYLLTYPIRYDFLAPSSKPSLIASLSCIRRSLRTRRRDAEDVTLNRCLMRRSMFESHPFSISVGWSMRSYTYRHKPVLSSDRSRNLRLAKFYVGDIHRSQWSALTRVAGCAFP
jgi:hypothetical protein